MFMEMVTNNSKLKTFIQIKRKDISKKKNTTILVQDNKKLIDRECKRGNV